VASPSVGLQAEVAEQLKVIAEHLEVPLMRPFAVRF